ncbi:MAG TPA: hypothetical protein VMR41_06360, partial [Patescibacteria group bacterium]|nr:hypothetical protein [Patescibacteria group bacterium]
DVESYITSTEKKQAYGFVQACKSVKEGKNIKEIHEEAPQFVHNHKRKLEEYIELVEGFKRMKEYPKFTGLPVPMDKPERKAQIQFINYAMLKGSKKTLWIHGKTRTGKSTVLTGDDRFPNIDCLSNYYKCYRWDTNETKQHEDIASADYIVIDEFKGQIKMSELLQLLDQLTGYKVSIKGKSSMFLKKRIPIFITAQHGPEYTYNNVDRFSMEALKRRLYVVELTEQYEQQIEDVEDYDVPIIDPILPTLELRRQDAIMSSALLGDSSTLSLSDEEKN